jgi:hypothetical protein
MNPTLTGLLLAAPYPATVEGFNYYVTSTLPA